MLRYIFGEVEAVCGVASNQIRNFEVEDTASITLKFINGVIANIFITDSSPSCYSYETTTGENNFYHKYKANCAFYFGTEGTLTFPGFDLIYHAGKKGWHYPISIKSYTDGVKTIDPLYVELKHFCNIIRGKERPLITVEDGLKTLELTEQIKLSCSKGGKQIRTL